MTLIFFKSQARKEVLIKVVAQAILTYTMSFFKSLDSLCDELTSMKKYGLAKLGKFMCSKGIWRHGL